MAKVRDSSLKECVGSKIKAFGRSQLFDGEHGDDRAFLPKKVGLSGAERGAQVPSSQFPVPSSHKLIGSKEWANSQLRFSIQILKGYICKSTWKGRLEIALIVKARLLEGGYIWQAKRVDNWIHRLQPRKVDLQREKRGASS